METRERRYSLFFRGILVGGILGGITSLLFAPKSGKELRGDIKATRDRVLNKANAALGKASNQFSEIRHRTKQAISCYKEGEEAVPRYGGEFKQEYGGEA